MRSIIAAGALLLIGSAAVQAQPFFGYPPPPPPPGFGFGWPHPHPHWHCHNSFDWRGPVRVCRWGW